MGLNSFSNWPRSSLGQIGRIKLQFVTNFSNFDLFTAALGFPFMHIASRIIQNHQCVYGLTHTQPEDSHAKLNSGCRQVMGQHWNPLLVDLSTYLWASVSLFLSLPWGLVDWDLPKGALFSATWLLPVDWAVTVSYLHRRDTAHAHTLTNSHTVNMHTGVWHPEGSLWWGRVRQPRDLAALGNESMPSVKSWPCAGCDMSKAAVWAANKQSLKVIHGAMLCQEWEWIWATRESNNKQKSI